MADYIVRVFYQHGIETVGAVKRVSFVALMTDSDNVTEWHYFGVTTDDREPDTPDPINLYTYVQFPQDADNLPSGEAEDLWYQLGSKCGFAREGYK